VNGKEFAEAIGVAHGTVKRWLHEGMPATRIRLGREVSIDEAAARAWVTEHHANSVSFNRAAVVYVARRERDGALKIGWTSDVMRRVHELRRRERCAVELVAAVPGAKPDELRMHETFRACRIDGEWFDAEVNDVVRALKGAA
jgi:hypothetical protein